MLNGMHAESRFDGRIYNRIQIYWHPQSFYFNIWKIKNGCVKINNKLKKKNKNQNSI